MTPPSTQSVLINGFGVLFVILNSFGLGLRLSVGKLLAQAGPVLCRGPECGYALRSHPRPTGQGGGQQARHPAQ